jgi:hypothetical protein
MRGKINAPPPCIQRDDFPPPTFPYTTRIWFDEQRLYLLARNRISTNKNTARNAVPIITKLKFI